MTHSSCMMNCRFWIWRKKKSSNPKFVLIVWIFSFKGHWQGRVGSQRVSRLACCPKVVWMVDNPKRMLLLKIMFMPPLTATPHPQNQNRISPSVPFISFFCLQRLELNQAWILAILFYLLKLDLIKLGSFPSPPLATCGPVLLSLLPPPQRDLSGHYGLCFNHCHPMSQGS